MEIDFSKKFKKEIEAFQNWQQNGRNTIYGSSERKQFDEEKNEKIKVMQEILKSYGIEMHVSGCGCCGSPAVTFIHKDVFVLWDLEETVF